MIHKSKAATYWAIVRAVWIGAGIIKPTDPELLVGDRYYDDDGNMIGWKIEHHSHDLRLRFQGSDCSADIHKETAGLELGDDWIKIDEHSYNYQSHPLDPSGPLSFRIDLDPKVQPNELHANPDPILVQNGRMVAHINPDDLDLDIRNFNAAQFIYVVTLYRAGLTYPLEPRIADEYHSGLDRLRMEVSVNE